MTLHVLHDEIGTATSPFGVVLGRVDDDITVLTFENLQQFPFLHHLQHRNPANALGSRNMNGIKVSPPWTSPRGEFLLLLLRCPVTSPHRYHHTFLVTFLPLTFLASSLSTADPHHPSLMRITINAKWESLLKQLRIYSLLLLSEPSLPPGCRELFYLQRNTSLITFDMFVLRPG